jgi:hypothetical protein
VKLLQAIRNQPVRGELAPVRGKQPLFKMFEVQKPKNFFFTTSLRGAAYPLLNPAPRMRHSKMPPPCFHSAIKTSLVATAVLLLSTSPALADNVQLQSRVDHIQATADEAQIFSKRAPDFDQRTVKNVGAAQQADSIYPLASGTFAKDEVDTGSNGKVEMHIVGLWGVGLITGTPGMPNHVAGKQFVEIEPGPSNKSKLVPPSEISPLSTKARALPISQNDGESDTTMKQISVKGTLLDK